MATNGNPPFRPEPSASAPIDPILQARLAELRSRRPETEAPLPRQRAGAGQPRTAPAPAPTSRTRPATRRSHAARGSRSAALAISLSATGALTAWFAVDNTSATSSAAKISTEAPVAASAADTPTSVAESPAATPTTGPAVAATPATTVKAATTTAAATTAPAATAPAATGSGLSNGTFTGQSISTRWGPVQVSVTVSAGKVTNVTTLAVPNDRQKSVSINNRATPILRSEALSAQTSSIDTVSGATYTSDGYSQSLQSALDQARTGQSVASA